MSSRPPFGIGVWLRRMQPDVFRVYLTVLMICACPKDRAAAARRCADTPAICRPWASTDRTWQGDFIVSRRACSIWRHKGRRLYRAGNLISSVNAPDFSSAMSPSHGRQRASVSAAAAASPWATAQWADLRLRCGAGRRQPGADPCAVPACRRASSKHFCAIS